MYQYPTCSTLNNENEENWRHHIVAQIESIDPKSESPVNVRNFGQKIKFSDFEVKFKDLTWDPVKVQISSKTEIQC